MQEILSVPVLWVKCIEGLSSQPWLRAGGAGSLDSATNTALGLIVLGQTLLNTETVQSPLRITSSIRRRYRGAWRGAEGRLSERV